MSGGVFRKYLSILFKTIFGVFPPVTCRRKAFLVFLIKKVFVAEENSGLHKRIIFMNLSHESFPILVFEESVNRNNIIMIGKGYHYVINLVIVSNFYISIEPVYPGSMPKDLS